MKVGELIRHYTGGLNTVRKLCDTQLFALAPVARFWANVDVANVDVHGVSRYAAERRRGLWTNAHGKRPAKDGTIRRELGALNAVLSWAHKRGMVDRLVTTDLPPMSPPRTNFLAWSEAERFWNRAETQVLACSQHKAAALFGLIALDTGGRAASIEQLLWKQVGQNGRGGNWSIDYRDPNKPVTTKRRMLVPCSDRLSNLLVSEFSRTMPDQWDHVVGPVSQYAWGKFLDEIGFSRDLTRHDLRRTFASLAVARGVDILKVATALGDNVQTVIKHYAHFAPDYLADLHEKTPGA
jgi:integrase